MASKRHEQAEQTCTKDGTFPANDNFTKPISVLRFLTAELTRGYLLEREEEKYAQKRRRVYTFMKTPIELEKFSTYGFFQCVDAFLFVFTFLPLRILLAVLKMITVPCGFMRSRNLLEPAQICDILKGVILVVCFFIMMHIDTSMMYHIVRGQATIKLYVFFNMLDMADRLLSNFGHDILDALFWTATEPRGRKRDHIGTLPHLAIAIVYVIIHTMLILFQATVLNVAFNSHNKSLLVIMMSNNFVEIKANLFKKVDVNHLYQIACSDVKERFHYVLLLSVVCIRNMTEVSWDFDHLWVLLPDAMMVLVSEILVDWGKHAFILKFNEIQADVYGEFKVKLAIDMANSRQNHAFTDHSDLVSRRMGLTPLPLACLLFRILTKSVKLTSWMSYAIVIVLYLCLVSFKILNSIVLLGHSYEVIESSKAERQSESSNHSQESSSQSYSQEEKTSASQPATYEGPVSQPQQASPGKHKRNASDSTVSNNFSDIFSADSYTELTFVQDTSVIEHSGSMPFTLTNSASDPSLHDMITTDSTDTNVNTTSYTNYVPISHPTISQSHDTQLRSRDNDLTSNDNDFNSNDTVIRPQETDQESYDTPQEPAEVAESDGISRFPDPQETVACSELSPGFLQSDSFNSAEDSRLVQRNQRRFFVSFDNTPTVGSSASQPETLGQNGNDEQVETSTITNGVKDEKLD